MFSCIVVIAFLGGCLAMPTHNATVDSENATIIEIDCTLYRPYAGNVHMYEVFTQGNWENQTCLQALIWDQDMCRCENPPTDDTDCPSNRPVPGFPNQYQVFVWGIWQENVRECDRDQIWNQTECRCIWDPEGPGAVVEAPGFTYPTVERSCDTMFYATFDNGIEDLQSGYYIERNPWDAIMDTMDVEGAIGGGAVYVQKGRMIIYAMAGNDFSDVFQIQLRYKLDNEESTNSDVTLFSNDCNRPDATLSLKYNPLSNEYQVLFRDAVELKTLTCQAQNLPNGFVTVSFEYQEETLSLVIDGQEADCGPQSFSGKPPPSACPLYLAGDPSGTDNTFKGYLDEVVIRRHCVIKA